MSGFTFLDRRGRPSIKFDPEFLGWPSAIPRLWYIEQSRLLSAGDERLYGPTAFADFYSRTVTTSIPEPQTTASIGFRGYRSVIAVDVGVPVSTADRIVSYTRVNVVTLPGISVISGAFDGASRIVKDIVDEPT